MSLQEKKPRAFEKIAKFPDRIKNHESVALVQLQYNYACNFKCQHCAIEKFKQGGKPSLTVEDVKSIADQCDEMGLASICVSGGEPLIFPNLKEIVDAIGPERFNISIDTNGYFLTDEKVKWLVDIGVDRIHLSIDGLESNHSAFRGNDKSWTKCVEALPLCKKHGLGVIINIVATRGVVRSGEIIQQLEFVRQFGFHASIIYAKAAGAFENHKDEILEPEDFQTIRGLTKIYDCSEHLTPLGGYEFGCLCFKRHFSITAYGDVLPCPWIPIKMGNVLKEPLADIVQRGLNNPWFSYDSKFSCLSGNCKGKFFNNVLPQIDRAGEYPASHEKIEWGTK